MADMKYIMLYLDSLPTLHEMQFDEVGRLVIALMEYAATGETSVQLGGERYAFSLLRAQLDRDAESYARKLESCRENGKKGGRPRKNPENPAVFSETQGNPENPAVFLETQKRQYKEKDKDKEEEEEDNIFSAASASRPDFNTVEVYAANNLQTLSPGNMEELAVFKDDLSEELIRHAIDEACAAGKRSWGYTRSILYRYISDGVKTIGEARQQSQPKRTTGNGPNWAEP